MICYKDRTFCSKRDCPNKKCAHNLKNIPWDKLPEWMCVSMRDTAGKFEYCPKNAEVQEDG